MYSLHLPEFHSWLSPAINLSSFPNGRHFGSLSAARNMTSSRPGFRTASREGRETGPGGAEGPPATARLKLEAVCRPVACSEAIGVQYQPCGDRRPEAAREASGGPGRRARRAGHYKRQARRTLKAAGDTRRALRHRCRHARKSCPSEGGQAIKCRHNVIFGSWSNLLLYYSSVFVYFTYIADRTSILAILEWNCL